MPSTSKSLIVFILLLCVLLHQFNWIVTDHDYQIWDYQLKECLKSYLVPAFITKAEKQYLSTRDIDDGLPLIAIKYINTDVKCLMLNYDNKKNGLLTLENYHLELWNDVNILEKHFDPFPSFINNINRFSVSSDRQLLSIIPGRVSRS